MVASNTQCTSTAVILTACVPKDSCSIFQTNCRFLFCHIYNQKTLSNLEVLTTGWIRQRPEWGFIIKYYCVKELHYFLLIGVLQIYTGLTSGEYIKMLDFFQEEAEKVTLVLNEVTSAILSAHSYVNVWNPHAYREALLSRSILCRMLSDKASLMIWMFKWQRLGGGYDAVFQQNYRKSISAGQGRMRGNSATRNHETHTVVVLLFSLDMNSVPGLTD